MAPTPYNPAVRLACKKCHAQTGHVMIDFSNDPGSVLTLFYECQECFTVKKVVELNTLPELRVANLGGGAEEKSTNGENRGPLIPIERGPQIGN